MASLNVFPACRMRAFAALVTQELGVQVRMRGREICVRLGKPPIIFLPNLEYAREMDLLPIYGFCLHEAAHIAFTNPKIGAKAPNYLVKIIHNTVEDEYIERRLERNFPGARAMLTHAYVEGIKLVCGEHPVEKISYIAPEGRDKVLQYMKSVVGMDIDDAQLVEDVARRLEIERAAKLWILAARAYPIPLMDWESHPWRVVFEEATTPHARSTREAYEQALRIIERLGVRPVLPHDARPIEKISEARAAKDRVREARRLLRLARLEVEAEARKQSETTPEYAALNDAVERACESPDSAEAMVSEQQARDKYEEACRQIRAEVRERRASEIKTLAKDSSEKSAAARAAKAMAKQATELIKRRDAEVSPSVAKGAMEAVVEAQIKAYKGEGLDEELGTASSAKGDGEVTTTGRPGPDLSDAGKYMPLDRSLDRIEKIAATPSSKQAYDAARSTHARTIYETIERLRRLRSSKLTKIKHNAPEGRLDRRKTAAVGLGMAGAPVDLRHVWRALSVKNDAKVAMSLLIDCSGSMGGSAGSSGQTRIALARQAAACLAEVLSTLGIPHEILGHTTHDADAEKLEFAPADLETYSRVVPFRGYEFKSFTENAAVVSVFSDFPMQSNLDGEAVEWAARRLAARREKTKLLIVISDGMPCAEMSNSAELERHLYATAKRIEARRDDGLHLAALGIGEERVRSFYANAEVINAVEGLPAAVLGIVERVLAKIGSR